jgi:hypothetical protein
VEFLRDASALLLLQRHHPPGQLAKAFLLNLALALEAEAFADVFEHEHRVRPRTPCILDGLAGRTNIDVFPGSIPEPQPTPDAFAGGPIAGAL